MADITDINKVRALCPIREEGSGFNRVSDVMPTREVTRLDAALPGADQCPTCAEPLDQHAGAGCLEPVIHTRRPVEQHMTKPLPEGIDPHYKGRVVLPGAILHLASWTEPKILDWDDNRADADWINDHRYGDTIGHIDWSAVWPSPGGGRNDRDVDARRPATRPDQTRVGLHQTTARRSLHPRPQRPAGDPSTLPACGALEPEAPSWRST
jgi:hypothetical protein